MVPGEMGQVKTERVCSRHGPRRGDSVRGKDEAKAILGFCLYIWMHGNDISQDGKPRGGKQIEGGKRMESLCWPWVN